MAFSVAASVYRCTMSMWLLVVQLFLVIYPASIISHIWVHL